MGSMEQVRAAPWLWEPLLLLVQGMFFPRVREDQELENHAVEPVIKETERMVYVAFSEYFFDSAMHSYFQAGVLTIELQGEKVRSTRRSDCVQAGGRGGLYYRAKEVPSREQLCWDLQQWLAPPPVVCALHRCPRTWRFC